MDWKLDSVSIIRHGWHKCLLKKGDFYWIRRGRVGTLVWAPQGGRRLKTSLIPAASFPEQTLLDISIYKAITPHHVRREETQYRNQGIIVFKQLGKDKLLQIIRPVIKIPEPNNQPQFSPRAVPPHLSLIITVLMHTVLLTASYSTKLHVVMSHSKVRKAEKYISVFHKKHKSVQASWALFQGC